MRSLVKRNVAGILHHPLSNFAICVAIVVICIGFVVCKEQGNKFKCCHIPKAALQDAKDITQLSSQFVIILGAQKSGTTALFHMLAQHPNTRMATSKFGRVPKNNDYLKELEFFNKHGKPGFYKYLRSFNITALKEGYTMFEGTPEYLLSPGAACRIKSYLPDARLLVVLKDPAERALSNFIMAEQRIVCQCKSNWGCKPCGKPLPSFLKQVKQQIKQFEEKGCNLFNSTWNSCFGCLIYRMGDILPRGLYASQIKAWLEYFPAEQLLVLSSKDIYNVQETSKKVYKFVNLEPFELDHVAGFPGSKRNRTEDVVNGLKLLQDFYAPYNNMLYDLMKKEFGIKHFSYD